MRRAHSIYLLIVGAIALLASALANKSAPQGKWAHAMVVACVAIPVFTLAVGYAFEGSVFPGSAAVDGVNLSRPLEPMPAGKSPSAPQP